MQDIKNFEEVISIKRKKKKVFIIFDCFQGISKKTGYNQVNHYFHNSSILWGKIKKKFFFNLQIRIIFAKGIYYGINCVVG